MEISRAMPSICIPRVFLDTTKYDIISVFEKILGKGSVHRVDLIRNQNGMEGYQRAFVHFSSKCNNSPYYNVMMRRLSEGLDIKVVYSDCWFWKCSLIRVSQRDY